MEDDIDIEEHDVLDNPKIRTIFPDLSLVKKEVPDEEYEDQYELQEETPPELEYQEFNIKKERSSDDEINIHFDGSENTFEENEETSFEQSETSHTEQNNDNCYFEQSEHSETEQFANEIVTKPVPDYDTLYQEALNSNITVDLEDWEEKLQNSTCYCKQCEILFPTINALDAHRSVAHSFLVALDIPSNTARKSTVTTSSTYCNHCDKTFPNDTALITHLYELLPLNDFQKQRAQPVAKLTLFKCDKCMKSFASLPDLKRHTTMVHLPVSTKVVKLKQDKGKFFVSTSLIPKSTLFQCHKCQVNFLSCFAATCHTNFCDIFRNYVTCKVCKRKIRTKDSKVHELQHTFADILKIYTVHKNMYERVLIKCPNCMICFDEKLFWCHLKEKVCQRHTNFVHCNICNIDITKLRFDNHKAKHFAQRYTKKDFIVVEYVDISNTKRVKIVKNTNRVEKVAKGVILYYCDDCGACKKIFTQRGHLNGTCVNGTIKYCDVCGLGFTKNNVEEHRELHVRRNLSLNDFKIVSLKTGKEIKPPIPTFPSCGRCKMHFLNRQALNIHKCDTTPFKNCEYCHEKFDLKSFIPHSNFHTYKDIPKLLKKYNSINNMWNIVYLCVACELVTMNYDTAVSHSQDHINEIERPPSKVCKICDFDIIEKDHWNHTILHESNEAIKRQGFEILKFNYEDLFKEQWMDIFSTIPKQHKYQILTKSIYRCTRRVKFNVEIEARTKDYKFFCKKCKLEINIEDIKTHQLEGSCKFSAKYTCGTCHIKFATLDDCIIHEATHEITPKIYKVITFNDPKDEIFDQRLKDFDLPTPIKTKVQKPKVVKSMLEAFLSNKSVRAGSVSSKSSIKSGSSRTKKPSLKIKLKNSFQRCDGTAIFGNSNRIKLFKCEKCRSCLTYKRNLHAHKCIAPDSRRICKICKEYFTATHISAHMRLHARFPKLAKRKPLVVSFDPSKNVSEATIFQCECGLHFTSKQAIDKHITICDENLDISKETCSKCDLLFPTDVLVSHLCKHHSKNVDITVKVVKKPVKFYKCHDCSIVYGNLTDFDSHIFYCSPNKHRKECPECKEFVDQKNTASHRCVTDDDNIDTVKNTTATFSVWKCERCDVVYLNKESLGYHFKVNHVIQSQTVTCEICNLNFTTVSYKKHQDSHRGETGYIIKVIDPETMNFVIIKDRKFKYEVTNSKTKPLSCKKLKNDDNNSSINTKSPVPKKKYKRKYDEIFVADNVDEDKVVEVFRCVTCDVCFTSSKLHYHHINDNHINHIVMTIKTCEICNLKFTSAGIRKHIHSHLHSTSYTFKVINPDTMQFDIVKGDNFKTDAKNTKLNSTKHKMLNSEDDSDSNSIKTTHKPKKLRLDDDDSSNRTSSPVAKSKYEKSFDEEFKFKDDNDEITKVYRCSPCDVSFPNKRRFQYHVQCANHVTKRLVEPCSICGLKFTMNSLALHQPVHEMTGNYSIKVIDPETNETEMIKGKNKPHNVKKRSKSDNNARSKAKFTIEPEPSTSKMDFESIEIDNDGTVDSVFENFDPLNTSESILPDKDESIDIHESKQDSNKEDINRFLSAERKAKIRAQADNYTETIYKCLICKLHFMNASTLNSHIKRKKHSQKPFKCQNCGLNFTEKSLGTHNYIHHTKLQLALDEFELQTFSDANAKYLVQIDHNTELNDIFEENSFENGNNTFENEDTHNTDENTLNNTNDNLENTLENAKIQYYQCAECNVCFIEEEDCRKHCITHEVLNPKDFIECKICNFQFLIDSLKEHVNLHHREQFDIDNLLITEFKATDGKVKIDTYHAVDKVQSRLVSTTTDVVNESFEAEDIIGI